MQLLRDVVLRLHIAAQLIGNPVEKDRVGQCVIVDDVHLLQRGVELADFALPQSVLEGVNGLLVGLPILGFPLIDFLPLLLISHNLVDVGLFKKCVDDLQDEDLEFFAVEFWVFLVDSDEFLDVAGEFFLVGAAVADFVLELVLEFLLDTFGHLEG